MLIARFRKGNISCASSPPFRQINPLGNALICSFFIFLRTIFTRSARGITARLTTKSKSCFSSSPRQWRKDTFSSPIASATACPTLIFFPMLSTRWKWVSGNKIAKGMPGKPPPVPRSITEEPGLKRSIWVIPSE